MSADEIIEAAACDWQMPERLILAVRFVAGPLWERGLRFGAGCVLRGDGRFAGSGLDCDRDPSIARPALRIADRSSRPAAVIMQFRRAFGRCVFCHFDTLLWSVPFRPFRGFNLAQGRTVSRYLLDTNIISNITKPAPSEALLAWMENKSTRICSLPRFQSLIILPEGFLRCPVSRSALFSGA